MTSNIHWHAECHGNPEHPPLLFLHGFLGRGDDWKEIATPLPKYFHCLCPDLPYHGRTRVDCDTPLTMELVAQELDAWLDARGIARCAVVGYSMGGRLALQFAVQFPSRVTRLVLESASPGIEDEAQREQRRAHDARMAQRMEAMNADIALCQFLDEWYAQPLFETCRRYPERLKQLIASRMDNDPRNLAQCLRGMGAGAQDNLWPAACALQVPVLAIAGEEDHKYRAIAERLADRNKNLAASILSGCGHNVHWERPGPYTSLLEHFLQATQPPRQRR
jgi:2-succinyl-6-hydroxy-2,4-cyclohexadiene-1-carboxylate synthase